MTVYGYLMQYFASCILIELILEAEVTEDDLEPVA